LEIALFVLKSVKNRVALFLPSSCNGIATARAGFPPSVAALCTNDLNGRHFTRTSIAGKTPEHRSLLKRREV